MKAIESQGDHIKISNDNLFIYIGYYRRNQAQTN